LQNVNPGTSGNSVPPVQRTGTTCRTMPCDFGRGGFGV